MVGGLGGVDVVEGDVVVCAVEGTPVGWTPGVCVGFCIQTGF